MDRSIARSRVYNVLSLCYRYPDDEVYTWIGAGKWARGFKEAFNLLGEKQLNDCLRVIEQAIPGTKEDEQLAMTEEHTRLFSNGRSRALVPPFGSVYLEKDGLVPDASTSELLRFYGDAHFTLTGDLKDIPDHITHELGFMGVLAGEESQALGNVKIRSEEIQMNFLSRFILPWVPTFCEKVAEATRSSFYGHLAGLTKEFINFERNYLGVPEDLNLQRKNQ